MSFNLIDLVKDQLSEQVMSQLGGVLGGDSTQNSSAISSALPGLLSGLMGAGASNSGAEAMLGAISDQDDSILDNLGGLLGGSGQSSMMSAGANVLGSLLGSNGSGLGNLVGAVAGFSGAGKGPVKSLLGLLAPIVFGVIKRKLLGGGGGGLNVGSLMGMLNGQKDNITAAMPTGFSQHLSSNVTGAPQQVAREGKSFLGKLIPLALLAAALWFAYNMFFKGDVDNLAESARNTVGETVDSARDTMGSTVDSARDTMGDVASSAAGAVNGVSLGKDVTSVMGGLMSSLGSITDVASAEAALPQLTSATSELGNLAGMLNKLPAAAQEPIMKIVSDGLPQLQALLSKLDAIPGVGPVIKPVVEGLVQKLALFQPQPG